MTGIPKITNVVRHRQVNGLEVCDEKLNGVDKRDLEDIKMDEVIIRSWQIMYSELIRLSTQPRAMEGSAGAGKKVLERFEFFFSNCITTRILKLCLKFQLDRKSGNIYTGGTYNLMKLLKYTNSQACVIDRSNALQSFIFQ